MRIYEFAKEKKLPNKDLVNALKDAGFDVTTHMSVLADDARAFLEKKFGSSASVATAAQKKSIAKPQKAAQKPPEADKRKKIISQEQRAPLVEPTKTPLKKIEQPVLPDIPQAGGVAPDSRLSAKDVRPITEIARDDVALQEALERAMRGPGDIGIGKGIRGVKTHVRGIGGEKRPRRRRRSAARRAERRALPAAAPAAITEIQIKGDMPLYEAAQAMGKSPADLILLLLKKGMACNKNHILSPAILADLAHQFGIKVTSASTRTEVQGGRISRELKGNAVRRWPIVVVVGHVDHGKTTLLDYIRKTNVAGREKGGITQHLGAYEVASKHGKIVFLDTPGHEAFSLMRSRGINVTDLAILVVAADDGVMPQTIEAINFAKAAGVPMVIAITKIDKVASTAPIETVKRQLSQHDLLVEDWGGTITCVPISAKTGQGIAELLDMIVLQAELMDLQADPTLPARAFVLESRLDKGYGPVATVVPVEGTLKQGDFFVCGDVVGKVRLLINSVGERIAQAGPSVPAQVVGFDRYAALGSWLQVVDQAEYLKAKGARQGAVAGTVPSAAYGSTTEKDQKIIRLLIKVDTQGSKEAITRVLTNLMRDNPEATRRLQILSTSIGDIVERDITMAAETGSYVVGLHVRAERNAVALAKDKGVKIILHDIIYHLAEEIESLISKSRKAQVIITKAGEAVVRKVFPLKDGSVIAGCYVQEGVFARGNKVVCFRKGKKIGEGVINSLQRERKVVKEVHAGYECGFIVDGFNDWQEDDTVHCMQETKEIVR